MAFYNLERLSVLLVEDNAYIRDILESLLKTLGFGWVATAKNGQDAVEFLRLVAGKHGASGTMGIDLVISDLIMSPINGLLLLRWVRTSKDSPNRFMPFIMLSGAADRAYVEQSRDLGATEFLAKPFSVQSIYQKLLLLIDNPRQFVVTHHYLGPDRRRKHGVAPEGEERRKTQEQDVAVVYSPEKTVKPITPTDVWYFRLPNRLKEKVGGGLKFNEGGELPKDILDMAEKALERDALDFADWAMSYIAKLANLCAECLLKPAAARRHYFDEINLIAHELRGQGGTFGYPLISIFAKMLYDYTQPGCREDDNSLEIVKTHIDSMRAVIRDHVAGDGGQLGLDLMKALKLAIERFSVTA
ncbi:MAG: response regulator [Alphaproteobacteria bacterium]|nr:response regulator [Alphaproteobacteria bacterium]